MYVLSKPNRIKQILTLAGTSFFVIIVLLSYIITNNINYLYVFLFTLLASSIFNWIVSRVYDIRIKQNKILIENFYYKCRVIEPYLFDSVRNTPYFIPLIYPFFSPPYYLIKLKDGRSYTFYDASFKALASLYINKNEHSEVLTENILKHITVTN